MTVGQQCDLDAVLAGCRERALGVAGPRWPEARSGEVDRVRRGQAHVPSEAVDALLCRSDQAADWHAVAVADGQQHARPVFERLLSQPVPARERDVVAALAQFLL